MDISNIPPAPSIPPLRAKVGPFTKLRLAIGGIDEDILRRCPLGDWGVAKGIGAIGLCVATYLTSLFFLMANKLFAPAGQIRIEFLVPSLFFAIFIIVIDAFQISRTSWHLSGIAELKRGGLDISGGPGPRIKAGFFLAIRIMLLIGLAQLTSLFVSVLIYCRDINSPIQRKYLLANRHLIGPATALLEARIQRPAGRGTTPS